jgi:hypothetical protein
MQRAAMPSETRRSLERAIHQLAAQRRRYALALGAAPTDRARVRHRRTVERLDDEIAAHEEALAAMRSTPDMAIHPPREDKLLEQANTLVSGSFARGEIDDALRLDRGVVLRVIAVAFAVGFLVVALVMALAPS